MTQQHRTRVVAQLQQRAVETFDADLVGSIDRALAWAAEAGQAHPLGLGASFHDRIFQVRRRAAACQQRSLKRNMEGKSPNPAPLLQSAARTDRIVEQSHAPISLVPRGCAPRNTMCANS